MTEAHKLLQNDLQSVKTHLEANSIDTSGNWIQDLKEQISGKEYGDEKLIGLLSLVSETDAVVWDVVEVLEIKTYRGRQGQHAPLQVPLGYLKDRAYRYYDAQFRPCGFAEGHYYPLLEKGNGEPSAARRR